MSFQSESDLELVCIDSTNYMMQLTKGKKYFGLNVSEHANPYKLDHISDITIYLLDDLGQRAFYPSELFLPVSILRDKKLKQLGI